MFTPALRQPPETFREDLVARRGDRPGRERAEHVHHLADALVAAPAGKRIGGRGQGLGMLAAQDARPLDPAAEVAQGLRGGGVLVAAHLAEQVDKDMLVAQDARQAQRQFQPCAGVLDVVEQGQQVVDRLARAHVAQGRRIGHLQALVLFDLQPAQQFGGGRPVVECAQGPRRMLGFDRDVETAIYNTLPHNLDRLLRRHPLQCPVAFIGGTESAEMKQVGMSMTHKVVGREHPDRLRMVEGSHLFPMEKPHETAVVIDATLKALLR